ncbi:hypothetical protein CLOM_g22717 [Closterium sp. NIES-68]|nr:hypothetical protein CLOM_g22717 [Closterium sp. NIES-68]
MRTYGEQLRIVRREFRADLSNDSLRRLPRQLMPSFLAPFAAFLGAFLATALLGTLVFVPHALDGLPSGGNGGILGAAIRGTTIQAASRWEEQQRCLEELQSLRRWYSETGADAAFASSAVQPYRSMSSASSAAVSSTFASSAAKNLRAATRSLLSIEERRDSGFGSSSTSSISNQLLPPPAASAAAESASVRRVLTRTFTSPNLNPNAACAENETSGAALRAHLAAKAVELRATQVRIEEMQRTVGRVNYQKFLLDYALSETTVDWNDRLLPAQRMEEARRALAACSANGVVMAKKVPLWKGYACDASDDDIYSFLEYDPNRLCPDDWLATQALIFNHNCFSLPKRRCMARTNQRWGEPLPFPSALFTQDALKDENVRWSLHSCKSFTCLNTRVVGDCRNCFNLTLERNRWQRGFRGSLPIPIVIRMKHGSLRLGLDAGGGTGTFAAHMALYNVTILTTAMNVETVAGRTGGLPYMETLAQRGLIPLWLPHKARLPLFDNTLDLVTA